MRLSLGKLINKRVSSSTIPMSLLGDSLVYRRVVFGDRQVISDARLSLTGFFAGYR